MADLTLKIWRQDSWAPTDVVELWVGTPAPGPRTFWDASLAASTPEGGTLAVSAAAWPTRALQGGMGGQRIGSARLGVNVNGLKIGQASIGPCTLGNPSLPLVMEHRYHPPAGKLCGYLPAGIYLVDALGNRSSVLETKIKISDPPRGARGLRAVASETPGQATLTWTLSTDIEAA